MWVFPKSNVFDSSFADMNTFFSFAPAIFMFLIPAITMSTFAEEKKDGTIEFLLTKPLTDWQIIFGKYFSSLALVIVAIVPTLIYYYSVYSLGAPEGNIDSAAVAGSYIGMILLGAVFTSIGILASAVSMNQIVSFVIAVFLCYIFNSGFREFASINVWGKWSDPINQLGMDYHYESLSKGLIDSRDVIYFLSVISLMLLSTKLVLGSRKW
jgi:ABC-2 type transport system permease protein